MNVKCIFKLLLYNISPRALWTAVYCFVAYCRVFTCCQLPFCVFLFKFFTQPSGRGRSFACSNPLFFSSTHLHISLRLCPPRLGLIFLCCHIWQTGLMFRAPCAQADAGGAEICQSWAAKFFFHLEGCRFAKCTNALQCYHSADRVLKRSLKVLIQPAAN